MWLCRLYNTYYVWYVCAFLHADHAVSWCHLVLLGYVRIYVHALWNCMNLRNLVFECVWYTYIVQLIVLTNIYIFVHVNKYGYEIDRIDGIAVLQRNFNSIWFASTSNTRLQVARQRLNEMSDLTAFHFKLKGLESFGQRVTSWDLSQNVEIECMDLKLDNTWCELTVNCICSDWLYIYTANHFLFLVFLVCNSAPGALCKSLRWWLQGMCSPVRLAYSPGWCLWDMSRWGPCCRFLGAIFDVFLELPNGSWQKKHAAWHGASKLSVAANRWFKAACRKFQDQISYRTSAQLCTAQLCSIFGRHS